MKSIKLFSESLPDETKLDKRAIRQSTQKTRIIVKSNSDHLNHRTPI